ncbi:MAG: NTP transferase domain-containing protein [Bacteroides sp.]|nr:NTP transferase domain-containing protein [Bacteroides sp.]
MLTYKEFEVIKTLLAHAEDKGNALSILKNKIRYTVFHSEQEVEEVVALLQLKGYIKDNQVTDIAKNEIAPCKVESAVILAAGGADISSKSVYSMPKGLFVKDGETLIERQIKQLHEAGVKDITVVVGYKQEMYFFLMNKYGVEIVVNPDLKKNNVFSLYCAIDHLSNTYICNCDNYFFENPFSAYEYNAYHATVYKENAHNELIVRKNEFGRITDIYSGDKSGECIYGHAYIDKAFSTRLKRYLNAEIDDFRVSSLFWEEFVMRHKDNLDMYAREYPADFLYEFDSIQEIQNIDTLFLENVSGRINEKICEVFSCKVEDVHDIQILQKGLTNILFTFVVNDVKYIFRYPGDSSSFFIYRKNECRAQKLAAKAGVDNTYIYIDETGIKISRFMENCKNLNGVYYHDIELMKLLASKIRKFHEEGYDMPDAAQFDYNPIKECEHYMKEASKVKGNLFELFKDEWDAAYKLYAYAEKDGIKKTMCHNDINGDNCLLNDEEFNVIDWEFAGFNDPGYDFGRVIAGYDYDDPQVDEILAAYFGRPATPIERLHWIAYTGLHNWYYVGWAIYKESINESSRDWMFFFYKQAKRVFDYCLPKYKEIYGEI